MRVQQCAMRLLDRFTHRKALAADMGVSESELSRWASGVRGMPIEQFVHAARLFRYSHPERVTELLQLVASELDHTVLYTGEVAPPKVDMTEALLTVVDEAGDVASAIRAARADGTIDNDEATRIQEAAERLERAAATLRGVVRPTTSVCG